MKPVQLVFVSDGDEAWRTVQVAGAPARSPRCILVLPGAHVLAREIEVAGATPAQRRAAALATLAPDLAQPASQLICCLPAGGARRVALVAARTRVEAWQRVAKARGFAPDAALPDYLLLPAPDRGHVHLAAHGDDVIARTGATGFTCQRDLATRLVGSLAPIEMTLEQVAADAVRRGAIGNAPNLLAGLSIAASRAPMRSLVWPSVAAAAALVAASLAPWALAARINGATAELRAQGDDVARKALPDASRIVDAQAQLREAALPRERTGQALTYAAGIMEGLARTSGVQLARLEFSANGVMHASLSAADLSQLQPLRDHVTQLGLRSTETPGVSSANNLSVDFAVSNAP